MIFLSGFLNLLRKGNSIIGVRICGIALYRVGKVALQNLVLTFVLNIICGIALYRVGNVAVLNVVLTFVLNIICEIALYRVGKVALQNLVLTFVLNIINLHGGLNPLLNCS